LLDFEFITFAVTIIYNFKVMHCGKRFSELTQQLHRAVGSTLKHFIALPI